MRTWRVPLALGILATGLASASPVQLSFWYGLGGNLGQTLQAIVAKFNASQSAIHVTATYQGSYSGGGPEQQKLLAAIASGAVPDLAQMEANSLPPFAQSGALLDLGPYRKAYGLTGFLPGLLLSGRYQGKQYAVPFNRSVPVLFYNAAMFKAAGIQSPPTTWSQLAQDAKQLTHGQGSHKVYGFNVLADWWPWESWTLSSGGKIFNASGTKALFAQPQALRPMEIQQALLREGYANVHSGVNYWTDNVNDFAQGKTAMYIGSPGDTAQIRAEAVPSVKNAWRSAFVPKDRGHALVVPPGGGNIVVFKNVPKVQRQAALTFLHWLIQPAQQDYWSEQTGYLPATEAAAHAPAYQRYLKANPSFEVPISELRYMGAMPLNNHYLQMLQAVEQGLQGIFDQRRPVATTMQQVAARTDRMMGE